MEHTSSNQKPQPSEGRGNRFLSHVSRITLVIASLVAILIIAGTYFAYRYSFLPLPFISGQGGEVVAIEGFVPDLVLYAEASEVPVTYVPVDGAYRLLESGENASGASQTRVAIQSSEAGYGLLLDGKVVFSSTEPLSTPVLSPDGTRIAFAQLKQGIRREASQRPSSWHVDLLTVGASSTPVFLASGISPMFIDGVHVLVVEDSGIFSIDTNTSAAVSVHQESFEDRIPNMVYSPDRTKVAWTKLHDRTTTVYEINGSSFLTPLTLVPEAPDGMALSTSRLYVLRTAESNEAKTLVLGYAFTQDEPKVLLRIPADLGVTSLSL